jgi:hypothetical protein
MAWDVMPGCAQLGVAADAAVDGGGGSGDCFSGVADHELVGLVCAWDRLEAHMAARKLVALAEVFRRNPEDGFEPEPGRMPAVVHEFTRDQLALTLGESRYQADWLLTVAWHLATRLGATLEVLRDGVITRGKAELIVKLTQYLSDDEAKAVEAAILGRAGRLTPGGLRSALARAVMEVAPKAAKEQRQTAAKFARVERWAEDSGNAALMGRELPPDEVLACDQRICWWAGELRKAGLEGGMDELRARAFLDLVLGKDSRPRQDGTAAPAAGDSAGGDKAGSDSAGGTAQQPPGAGPASSTGGGFAGRVTLTVPLGTAAGLADRPGELAGLGPVDPWLARDLVNAAAANPKTTWCVTVTDQHGHAVGHGACSMPKSASSPRSSRLRLLTGGAGADLRDCLDLDRAAQGQCGDPDGRAGMGPGRAQDVEHQLRGAVSDLRLLGELAGAGDVDSELDQPRHRVKAASGGLQLGQYIHRACSGGLLPGHQVHLGTEPALRDELPVPGGDLPGGVDGVAVPDIGLERGNRDRGRRELQSEAGETVCGGAGSFVHLGSKSRARIRAR